MRYLMLLLLTVPLLSACVGADPSVVAVLVADGGSADRALDAEVFAEEVERVCEGCTVEVHDAGGDAAEQQRQFDEVVEAGVGGVVVEPVSPEVAEEFVLAAEGIPFVAAGTLVPGADWFVGTSAPVSGVEYASSLEAARALVAGDVQEVVHVPIAEISRGAADVVVHAMVRTPLAGAQEFEGVPSWLHEPQTLTTKNLTSVLVATGLVSLDEVCAGQVNRCARLGLQ